MRVIALLTLVFLSFPAGAKGISVPTSAARVDRHSLDIRVLGQLNVNSATADELRRLPGMDELALNALLKARTEGKLKSLDQVGGLKPEVRDHLKTDGPSDLRIIRPLPLTIIH